MDDLLNSDAFLKKKVEMLQKQIKATEDDTVTAHKQADEQWEEWGPQVSQPARSVRKLAKLAGFHVGRGFSFCGCMPKSKLA